LSSTRPTPTRQARRVIVLAAVALTALVGWPWVVSYPTRRAQDDRRLFREVGRQGALNHATISCVEVDNDVQIDSRGKPGLTAIHPNALPHTQSLSAAIASAAVCGAMCLSVEQFRAG
jgi:hypothetical protein